MNNLRVMTFNVAYPGEQSPNSWRERYPVMVNLLRETKPDVFGTQEGMFDNLQKLNDDLQDFGWFGAGREGANRGEHMAVFYRKSVLELLEHGDFWLSEAPDIQGSVSWNSAFPRMATWGRMRVRSTGNELLIVNTHLDHISEEARLKGAALIAERLHAFEDIPMVLTGDFNDEPDGPVYRKLVGQDGWKDCFVLSDTQENPETGPGTYHAYQDVVHCGPKRRIDWILLRGQWEADRYQKVVYQERGQYPSDHFPVMVELEIPE